MKNKNFKSYDKAKAYFDQVSREHICFLIDDLELNMYSVVNEDMLYHLQHTFNLHFNLLHEST